MSEASTPFATDGSRLALVRAVGAALAAPGDARERLDCALQLLTRDAARHVALELCAPGGQSARYSAGDDAALGSGSDVVAVQLSSGARAFGTLTLRAPSLGLEERLLAEIVGQQIAASLSCAADAGSERHELEPLLLSIVGHDLRNPLGVVTLGAATLLASELSAAQRKTVMRLLAAGRQSSRLAQPSS